MNRIWFIRGLLLLCLIGMLCYCEFRRPIHWQLWSEFKHHYISKEGRVVDPSSHRTTSEGQSYGLFFALVANDPDEFDTILSWTQANLTESNLNDQLPAWLWGENSEKIEDILDHNSSADSDLWIAYDLIEAGRLWGNTDYQHLGEHMLDRISKEEVAELPGLGPVVLPGKKGFTGTNTWELNPSYTPPQLLTRFATINATWLSVQQSNQRLLQETSPCGFAPDWVVWEQNKGWQPSAKDPNLGSYDAIRVYLWVGMMAEDDPSRAALVRHFQPMRDLTGERGVPPEKTNTFTCVAQGEGGLGFSAALLPMLRQTKALPVQEARLKGPLKADAYYNSVLRLFGEGWNGNKFRFNTQGQLVPAW
ncbi:MAG: cellulose synthase complex periplasmic endoglucanase BcsZ [Legionellales bacterium]